MSRKAIRHYYQGVDALTRHKSSYTHILKRLLSNQDWFAKSLGMLHVLASDEQLATITRKYLHSAEDSAVVTEILKSARYEVVTSLAYSSAERNGRSPEVLKIEIARALLELISASIDQVDDGAPANPFLTYLRSHLLLSELETRLLFGLYLRESCPDFSWMNHHTHSITEYTSLMAAFMGLDLYEVGRIINSDSKLILTGLIKVDQYAFFLNEGVCAAIGGLIDIPSFQAEQYEVDIAPVYDLKSFKVDQTDLDIMSSLLADQEQCNIIFYGRPGAGKTELARSLIRSVNRQTYQVKTKLVGSYQTRLARTQYAACFSRDAGIIVDEAELVLGTNYERVYFESDHAPTKASSNIFLDGHQSKIIWIVNDARSIHPSTLRRFDFALKFDKLSRDQRASAISMIRAKHEYDLNPQVMDTL